MMNIKSVINIGKEYGIPWVLYRTLYSLKLNMMKHFSSFEQCFEKKIEIKRWDIFQISSARLEKFYGTLSVEEKELLIQAADDACEGRIRGFSSVSLDFGNPIRWQLNPLTGKSCDAGKKWFQIPDFDSERGDIKVIWEASRFSHFISLARTYMVTKNRKYYEAFSEQIDSWVMANPYSYGANYKCGQECSIRMINLLLTAAIFSDYGLLSERDRDNIKSIVEGSTKKIESNFFYAYRCIKNNHTISELTGMIIGAWCQEDSRKLKKAYRILGKVIREQFTEDGGYCQYSFNYQRVAMQMLEIVYAIKDKTGLLPDKEARRRIYRSAMLLYQVQDEKSGDVPNYGSNDGALIFPLTLCGYRDFRPVINTISGLEKQQFLYSEGKWEEEYLWLSDRPCKRIHRKQQTSFFKTAGLYSYVNSYSRTMIIFQNLKKRPAQMDQLHLDLWSKGRNILCDSGTYSYADPLGEELITTMGHNTVKIQGKEQMKRRPPFLLYDWPECRLIHLSENEFEGIMESKNGYTHCRRLAFEEGGIYLTDKVRGDVPHGFDVVFHTPLEVVLEDKACYIVEDGQRIARIQTSGEISTADAYRSLYYLKKEKIKRIHIHTQTEEVRTKIVILGGNKHD